MMMRQTKWFSALLAIALLASTAAAADTVASGKIKSINADNKTFVLTDSADKDYTFKLGGDLVINRAGKEGKSDLKTGDSVSVCYDPGVFSWTSHYILIHEGATKNSTLSHGTFKSYDTEKKQLAFTDSLKKDTMYAMGDAMVRVNMKDSTVQDLKIGEHALLITNNVAGKTTLASVMVQRAK
jgi:phosphate-selective porin